jgi:DNA-binding MarR family transcriptional regulator
MATEEMQERILNYLSRRPATPEHLAQHLGISSEELRPVLDEMEAKGWVNAGISVWYSDPASAITVVTLLPAGREEAKRRQALSDESNEPVELTRDELVAELQRRYGLSEEQIALEPSLRHTRFEFWPSIGAWAGLPD